MKSELLKKIRDKSAIVSVVGLGYVGLPLLKRLNEVGFNTIGLDIDQSKVDQLTQGKAYIKHIAIDSIHTAIQTGKCRVSADYSIATGADVIILCVPTPLNKYREPDLNYVIGSLDTLLPYLHKGQMLSLESTTYPGTTEEELLPRIEQQDLLVGEEFFLVYSPEREDPGNKEYSTKSIPKICGGSTLSCLEVGKTFYSQIVNLVIDVSSTRVAEMTKILENTYRAVNIALVNELKIVADKMGIDIFEVINAAATKPFGYKAFYPGPGLGGHCIPIDPFYLTWKAREFGLHTRFIELAGEINSSMPKYVVTKLNDALNTVQKSINGSKILILGIAYKKNVDDMRESPGLIILDLLLECGADVEYSDPHISKIPAQRGHGVSPINYLFSVALNKRNLSTYDCVLLATDHDSFNYDLIAEASKLVVDTRGVYKQHRPNIIRT